MIKSESNLKNSSNILDGIVEFEDIPKDMKKIDFGTSTKDIKIPSNRFFYLKKKTELPRLDHMSHHLVLQVSPLVDPSRGTSDTKKIRPTKFES